MSKKSISAVFPFESKFVDIKGSQMHYVDEGDTNSKYTFLLIHGNPTSSYLWRNIIPYLSPLTRTIAIDLIGMGKSGKPDIGYTFKDHIEYVNEFISKLELKNIILVIQDWGSGIGFNYANNHRENVAGIVFFEAIVRAITWKDANLIERFLFKRFRHPKKGQKMIGKNNFFVKRFLPMMAGRKLSKEEMEHYKAPYPDEASRKPLVVWPSQIAINGTPAFSQKIKDSYASYLPESEVPKLFFHARPGMIIKKKEAKEIETTWKNLETIDLGKGKHYLQEQYPHELGEGIANWFVKTFENKN